MTTKISILGGCFPVQEQIKSELIYHNIIKERLAEEKQTETEFLIYRYDTFDECLGLLETIKKENTSCILLHIRPDPYLRASKIYIKYVDGDFKKQIKVNFHLFGFSEPDINPVNFGSESSGGVLSSLLGVIRKKIRCVFRNMNYTAGFLAGNNLITKKTILKTIGKLKIFCGENKISLVIQGPPLRPRSKIENLLLKSLDKFLMKSQDKDIEYLQGLFEKDDSDNFIFLEDKIHLNVYGHRLYANLLYRKLSNLKFTSVKNSSIKKNKYFLNTIK